MGWTKRELIVQAFEEVGLASYVFDLSPEQLQSALRRLDTMMATWDARGIRIGYALPATPGESDLDTPSGIPDTAVEAVYLNLGIRIAPGFGKAVLSDTKASARAAYDALTWAAAQPIEQQLPNTMPRGAGNKPWRTTEQPFMPRPDDSPLRTSQGGDLDILPE